MFGGAPADYKPIRSELNRLGLKCTTATALTKETSAISPDAATRKKGVEWLKTVVEINHVLGAETVCGPYHSALGEFSGAGPTVDEKTRSAGRCRTWPPRRGCSATCSRPPEDVYTKGIKFIEEQLDGKSTRVG